MDSNSASLLQSRVGSISELSITGEKIPSPGYFGLVSVSVGVVTSLLLSLDKNLNLIHLMSIAWENHTKKRPSIMTPRLW